MALVRVRLLLIAAILAVLAFAGPVEREHRSPEPRDHAPVSSQFVGERAPDPALPAIIEPVVAASSLAQTLAYGECRRLLPPALEGLAANPHVPAIPDGGTGPRSFPLLI
jgi:hypothetical protein